MIVELIKNTKFKVGWWLFPFVKDSIDAMVLLWSTVYTRTEKNKHKLDYINYAVYNLFNEFPVIIDGDDLSLYGNEMYHIVENATKSKWKLTWRVIHAWLHGIKYWDREWEINSHKFGESLRGRTPKQIFSELKDLEYQFKIDRQNKNNT